MEALLGTVTGWITGNLSSLALLGGLPIAFMLGTKYAKKYIGDLGSSIIAKGMGDLDKIDDPILKKLMQDLALAFCKVAEYLVPDKGMGEAKFAMVSKKMIAVLPFLKGQEKRLKVLIDSAVIAMDVELKGAVDILKQ